MGQVVGAWQDITATALQTLFDGSDSSISTLTTLLSDGKLIEGGWSSMPTGEPNATGNSINHMIAKAFFGYAIPALWSAAGTHAFIIDSGYACGTTDPIGQYMDADTMHKTWACNPSNNQLYYLAWPSGDAEDCSVTGGGDSGSGTSCSDNLFSAPPGIDSLDGTQFGGITVSDLVIG
jgi:hypothetical protein